MSNYNDLDIYKMAYKLAIEVHHLSLTLPKYKLYEQESQACRSSKSIKDSIAEGYGRKRDKADFIKFLTYAQASYNDTISQLTMINELHFTENKQVYTICWFKLENLKQTTNNKIEKQINYQNQKQVSNSASFHLISEF